MTRTLECNVERFKETIWYIQTRKQANLLEVKLINWLGPNWRSWAEWIATFLTLSCFTLSLVFFLFDPWYSQTAMSNVFLKNTLHKSLCLALPSPQSPGQWETVESIYAKYKTQREIFAEQPLWIFTKSPNVSQETNFFWLQNIT